MADETVSNPLLDLVRKHGDAMRDVGYADGRNFDTNNDLEKAAALLDRIAALAPALPVQARDYADRTWWIHACGTTPVAFYNAPGGDAHHVFPACKTPGPWRPLLVTE